MNGYEVCQQLRLQIETEKLPVLMLTAKAGKQDKLTGLAMAEANVYLTKPTDPAKFVATVRALLNKYPNPRTTVTAAPTLRLPK
jgi:DNA-binding response OmpR family regulator